MYSRGCICRILVLCKLITCHGERRKRCRRKKEKNVSVFSHMKMSFTPSQFIYLWGTFVFEPLSFDLELPFKAAGLPVVSHVFVWEESTGCRAKVEPHLMLMGKQPFPTLCDNVRMCVCKVLRRKIWNLTHKYTQGSAFNLYSPHSQAINIFPFSLRRHTRSLNSHSNGALTNTQ